ncbi:hypothetical protein VTL71DRAFT_12291 [Oculimacula yallundae]|uniref:Zn(2)-C6 fungal-type domain-containing protein n=1 Tax=Oculimacula yallundae TaxID=86028 RepID=A0ABR4CPA5_9HELO
MGPNGKPDNWVPILENPLNKPRKLKVACIGAGFSGLMLAYEHQHGPNPMSKYIDLTIYEKNADIGGTWLENTYPGVACDVPAHIYTFPFEPNPHWTQFYASGPEILAYIKRTSEKHNLEKNVQTNSQVLSSKWNDDAGKWHLEIQKKDHSVFQTDVDVLISGSGFLNKWSWPDIKGLHSFSGTLVHSASWKSGLDWENKRVAIIGNGSSAVQLLPVIQAKAASVVNFVRSPLWISSNFASEFTPEGVNFDYDEATRKNFEDNPDQLYDLRHKIEHAFNKLFFSLLKGSPEQVGAYALFTKQMQEQLNHDPWLCEKLIPKFEVGCRRLSPGDNYLTAIQAENVTLELSPIECVGAGGIKTKDDSEERPFDIIICATGFDVSFRPSWDMHGRNGIKLADQWKDHPEAYFGTVVSNMPNFFMINGPNSPLAHGSLLSAMYFTVEYIMKWCEKISTQDIKSVQVKQSAVDDYNVYTQEFMGRTVWSGSCNSWFKQGKGAARITAMYAGSVVHFKQMLEDFRGEDFDFVYNSRNRFRYMGNGISMIEEEGKDLACELIEHRHTAETAYSTSAYAIPASAYSPVTMARMGLAAARIMEMETQSSARDRTDDSEPRPYSAEPRRRTKKACLACQKKKLKCSGLQPCNACSSRLTQCVYADRTRDHTRAQARQGHRARILPILKVHEDARSGPVPRLNPPEIGRTDIGSSWSAHTHGESPAHLQAQGMPTDQLSPLAGGVLVTEQGAMAVGTREDTEDQSLQEQLRMLQDSKGRLLYLGDSATLSYLDTIRKLVESTLGPSSFTNDVHKGKIVEGSLSTSLRPFCVLPDREVADFLVDSFFSNTVGIIDIFDHDTFIEEVKCIYNSPLQAKQPRLSILNLVFAVGLQLLRPSTVSSPRGRQILERLDGGSVNRAEQFFVNSSYLNYPVSGFEDGDIVSCQALLIVTMFMLNMAKRSAAWAYIGMAIRIAYALGLHRKRADSTYNMTEQSVRRKVWRSLYVMDCFISTMLGRPNAITCRDAANSFPTAQDAVGTYKDSLPPLLHWQNIHLPDEDPKTTLAQLRVNLSYFHGIILLTRPFLLQRISEEIQIMRNADVVMQSRQTTELPEADTADTVQFQNACVKSALYSINAIQAALLKRALPRQDPFVIYWLSSAALIICTNGFCPVYKDLDNTQALNTAISLHRYFGDADPLAHRFLGILLAFSEAIAQDNVPCPQPIPRKSKQGGSLASLFAAMPYRTGFNADGSQLPEVGFQSAMEREIEQQALLNANTMEFSPADDFMDFDTFFANFDHDPAFQADLWTPSLWETSVPM